MAPLLGPKALNFALVAPLVSSVRQVQPHALTAQQASIKAQSLLLLVTRVLRAPSAALLEPQAHLPAYAVAEERARLPQASLRAPPVGRALSVILAQLYAPAVPRVLTAQLLANHHAFPARLASSMVPAPHPATLAHMATLVSPLPLGPWPSALRAQQALLAPPVRQLASTRSHRARRELTRTHLLRAARVPRVHTA
jgi:hypothetical protein